MRLFGAHDGCCAIWPENSVSRFTRRVRVWTT